MSTERNFDLNGEVLNSMQRLLSWNAQKLSIEAEIYL